ncbi:NtaA/DmoA family FMN-dependent monooxygenase [Paracoccus kondratievae]|uniref:N5,N10-methylene tetrahydromethanopterin reductase n=1 Tax=Paracoccus kondratievae TaxID=135740 RepID=A0AAD3RUU8_9RHOB|nr:MULTISPECIES: LLM class flavin-dependent oxidoreductase [Paracoccus]QFQ89256.1 NtaA/DmoA family FMN-dependent monooxygenase [Paracoccus kondratievae]GLK65024.1 N5,N10-methylene tetrahydromethanopterin reductase [Paracoccus kondratievae]SMG55049.1 alkanesulfonate monooxygenase [Paracoccus sp. J56]
MARLGKHIIVNAFNMNCVGHINHGQWTHPHDRSADYTRLDYWTDLARTLERGLFDGLFLADIIGTYDVYGGGIDVTLRESVQLPVNDPILLISAMAAVTQNLGFGVTVNVNQEAPYTFARRISTLDHLTQGRIGWNIVTGYLDSAARAVGQNGQTNHDLRYDQADEYLEVLYKLWEWSWDDDAVIRDRAARVYADPAKVRKVVHHGRFYDVEGWHLSEPSPQRTPVLFQAGTSGRGQLFAARHAECVFISAPEKQLARKAAQSIRAAVAAAGRRPEDVKIIIGINVITDRSAAAALEKLAEYRAHSSPEAGLAHFAASTGIDFSRYDLDDPIPYGPTNSIQSATKLAESRGWTKRDLLNQLALGGRYPLAVGTPTEVADELESWVREGDIDGFNLTRLATPETYEDFADLIVPELQTRDSFKTEYAPGTLRHKIFGQGDRLPDRHTVANFRPGPAVAAQ